MKIHSTNQLERLNGDIRRRPYVVGILINDEAMMRPIGALLLEQNDEWAVQHGRCLKTIAPLSDDLIVKQAGAFAETGGRFRPELRILEEAVLLVWSER